MLFTLAGAHVFALGAVSEVRSASFPLPPPLVALMRDEGLELGQADDKVCTTHTRTHKHTHTHTHINIYTHIHTHIHTHTMWQAGHNRHGYGLQGSGEEGAKCSCLTRCGLGF